MNYFELFNIPVQLKVDKEVLRQRYFELSRRYHTDDYRHHSSSHQEQETAPQALLDKAYQTLQSMDDTIHYVLQEKGLLTGTEEHHLSPDFLMQMREVSEALAEAPFPDDENAKARVLQQLSDIEKVLYGQVQPVVEHYREGVTTSNELQQVKDYYFKKKYIHRLAQQIAQKS